MNALQATVLFLLTGAALYAADISTTDGVTFRNAIIKEVDGMVATIEYEGGTARIHLSRLPTEYQKAYSPAAYGNPADYFVMADNTRYVYAGVFMKDGKEFRIDASVVCKKLNNDGSVLFYFIKEGEIGSNSIIGTSGIGLGAYSAQSKGVFTYDAWWSQRLRAIKGSDAQLLLRSPLRVGDTNRIVGDGVSRSITVAGFEDISVPAGDFKSALKVTIREGHYESNAWFAKDVGMVKWIRHTGRIDRLVSFEHLK